MAVTPTRPDALMNLKSNFLKLLSIGILLLAAPIVSPAAVIYDWSGTQSIPDNDPGGVAFNFNLSVPDSSMFNLSLSFNVSGGYNGDLYAYLVHDAGFAVLLNRPGLSTGSTFGYGDAGFIVTLTDSQPLTDIHYYGGNGGALVSGMYNADGRNSSPFSSGAIFAGAARDAGLNSFDGLNPNGDWTLFFADVSGGSISTLNGLTLAISAVPEPVNVALMVFGGITGSATAWQLYRRKRRRRRF